MRETSRTQSTSSTISNSPGICAGGFTEEVIFVSKNKSDYGELDTPRIHHDLLPEIEDPAVRITYFTSLGAALGSVGI